MKCNRCYFENPDDAIYCINCGKKLPKNSIVKHKEDSIKNNNPQTPLNKEITEKSNNNLIPKNNKNEYYLIEFKDNPDTDKKDVVIHEIERKTVDQIIIKEHKPGDYYYVTYRGPERDENLIKTDENKKLWLTLLLSVLVIGAGHLYLNEYKKAFIFITIALISSIASTVWPEFIYVYMFNEIFQIWDAAICYRKINNKIS